MAPTHTHPHGMIINYGKSRRWKKFAIDTQRTLLTYRYFLFCFSSITQATVYKEQVKRGESSTMTMRNNRKLVYNNNIMYNIVTRTKSHWNIGRVISYFFFSHLFVAANFVSISIEDGFSLNEGARNVSFYLVDLCCWCFQFFVQSSHTQNKKNVYSNTKGLKST